DVPRPEAPPRRSAPRLSVPRRVPRRSLFRPANQATAEAHASGQAFRPVSQTTGKGPESGAAAIATRRLSRPTEQKPAAKNESASATQRKRSVAGDGRALVIGCGALARELVALTGGMP